MKDAMVQDDLQLGLIHDYELTESLNPKHQKLHIPRIVFVTPGHSLALSHSLSLHMWGVGGGGCLFLHAISHSFSSYHPSQFALIVFPTFLAQARVLSGLRYHPRRVFIRSSTDATLIGFFHLLITCVSRNRGFFFIAVSSTSSISQCDLHVVLPK